MPSLVPQHKQEKQLKDLEAARMKWSSGAETRAELRENSCELDTSSVQGCPQGAVGGWSFPSGGAGICAPSTARALLQFQPDLECF